MTEQVEYIKNNISQLDIEHKIYILRMIADSDGFDKNNIIDKKTGCVIKFKNIPVDTLEKICCYMSDMFQKKKKEIEDYLFED